MFVIHSLKVFLNVGQSIIITLRFFIALTLVVEEVDLELSDEMKN